MMKRAAGVYGLCIMLLMAMVLRLCWVGQGSYVQAMGSQSEYTLTVGQLRGGIYDCNFQPLVDREYHTVTAVAPTARLVGKMQQLSAQTRRRLAAGLEGGKPFVVEGDLGGLPGTAVFRLPTRYGDSTAAHVVGYLDGAGQGVTGIEAAYNSLLQERGQQCAVTCRVDALGHALEGELTATPQSPRQGGVVLTLDRRIQQLAEQAMAANGVTTGATVVVDVATGDIKAMASAPTFDQNNVAAALAQNNGALLNRALCPYSVGSTFKLVVAAAALEAGFGAEICFECPGCLEVEGNIFRCHNLAGHGSLDMEAALEHSCNIYFIRLAQQLGGQPIRQMAARLGFGSSTRLAEGVCGAAGLLTEQELLVGGELANFAFGQGRLSATPLQLAAMMAAFANGGSFNTPRLVAGTTADGRSLEQRQPDYAPVAAMQPQTAAALCQMMVQVVEEGSGGKARPASGGAGGKTASAQTGVYNSAGQEIVQAWFSGFYPAQNPRWAIVVLCENGGSGGDAAAPVFRQICSGLARLNIEAES